MKILVLGGTRFMGRHFVETAVARGHEVTLFNRGKTNPDLFQEIERLVGDRDDDLKPLHGRSWDVALDTCGYVPRVVRKSAALLADSVEHYTFVSSINAYAKYTEPGMDESGRLLVSLEQAPNRFRPAVAFRRRRMAIDYAEFHVLNNNVHTEYDRFRIASFGNIVGDALARPA